MGHQSKVSHETMGPCKVIKNYSLWNWFGRMCEKNFSWTTLFINSTIYLFFRAGREYWEQLEPASGRPYSQAFAHPDNWEVTRGHELFKQHVEPTSEKEMNDVKSFRKG